MSRACPSTSSANNSIPQIEIHGTRIAELAGFSIERRDPAWGAQYRDLGFARAEQAAAK
jgi:hypothetical protein